MIFTWGIVAFLVLSLGLTACGDDTSASLPVTTHTLQATNSQTSPSAAVLPMGSYITTLNAKDFHFELYEERPALRQYIGRWELQFADQNRFSIKFNNQPQVEGTYTLSSEELFLTSPKWPSLCQNYEAPANASFRWKVDSESKALDLFGKSDLCNIAGTALLMHKLVPLNAPVVTQ
jgi:hypothetical protein